MQDRDALVEKMAWGICKKCYPPKCTEPKPCQGCTENADAALDIAMAEAARVAETNGVYPELNVANGGPEWYRHGKDIAAAIRAYIKP